MSIIRTAVTTAFALLTKPAMIAVLSFILISSHARSESPQVELAELDDDNSFVLINARVVTANGIVAPAAVRVENGIITEVGQKVTQDSGLPVIDIDGQTVTPGFVDAHTHTFFDSQLFDSLRFGVTAQLDMSTSVNFMNAHRDERDELEDTEAADLYSAGMIVTSPGGHGTQNGAQIPTIDSPAKATEHIRARLDEGSDWIKIAYEADNKFLTSVDKPTLSALIDAAHEQGSLAVVHVSKLEAARDAVEAGADGLVHIFADKVVDDKLLALMQAKGTFVIPTLSVIASIVGNNNAQHWASKETGDLRLSRSQKHTLLADFQTYPGQEKLFKLDVAYENVRRMKAQGIPLLVGTDAPNAGTAHGVSIHDEFVHFINSGFTPAEALQAATSIPSKMFNLEDRGTIEVGKRADLVVFDGKPDENILDARKISRIYKNGYELE